MVTKEFVDDLSYEIFASIIEVHKNLGPGLIESIYHKCLAHELKLRNISFTSEASFDFNNKDLNLTTDFRCDLFVENCIMLELKAVEEIIPYFKTKLISQMKIAKAPKGILVNFNVKNIMSEGKFVFLNEHYNQLS
ncbi:GxxExxY protein [Flavobacterium sp. ZS1P70]|uniref:GxxExxY protein n=1 Tax=Flavobacterium zhoui TaxID=3230414 RepID=A0ABW6I5V5_9FLAO